MIVNMSYVLETRSEHDVTWRQIGFRKQPRRTRLLSSGNQLLLEPTSSSMVVTFTGSHAPPPIIPFPPSRIGNPPDHFESGVPSLVHAAQIFQANIGSSGLLSRVLLAAYFLLKELQELPAPSEAYQAACCPLSTADTPSACHKPSSNLKPAHFDEHPLHKMSKRRRSFQSFLIPSFLLPNFSDRSAPSTPTSKTLETPASRARSRSSLSLPLPLHPPAPRKLTSRKSRRASPPPGFLLDDDPFADLSSGPAPAPDSAMSRPQTPMSMSRAMWSPNPIHGPTNFGSSSVSLTGSISSSILSTSPVGTSLSSPIIDPDVYTENTQVVSRPSLVIRTSSKATPPKAASSPAVVTPVRQSSTPAARVRPAHEKPASTSRPSFPSLRSLARTSVTIPKVRRGNVGAGLPLEPWGPQSASSVDRQALQRLSAAFEADHQEALVSEPDALDVSPRMDYIVPDPEADAVESPVLSTSSISFSDRRARSVQLDDILESEDEHLQAFDSPSASDSSFPESIPPLRPISALRWFAEPQEDSDLSETLKSSLYIAVKDTKSPLGLGDPLDQQIHHKAYPFSRPPSDTPSDPDWGIRGYPYSAGSKSQAYYHSLGLFPEREDPLFEPSSSVPTITGIPLPRETSPQPPTPTRYTGEAMDSDNQDAGMGGQQNGSSGRGGFEYGGDRSTGRSNGHGDRGFSSNNGHGGQGDDDGRDDEKRRNLGSSFSSSSDSEDEAGQDESDSGHQRKGRDQESRDRSKPARSKSGPESSTDDDVPLAQRIPTAISAQRTIRQQVRDEREARRRQRDLMRSSLRTREPARSPPRAVGESGKRLPTDDNQDATSSTTARRRKKSIEQPFTAEDLAKKLRSVQAADTLPSAVTSHHPTPKPPSPLVQTGDASNTNTISQPTERATLRDRPEPKYIREGRSMRAVPIRNSNESQSQPPSGHDHLGSGHHLVSSNRPRTSSESSQLRPNTAPTLSEFGRSSVEKAPKSRVSEDHATELPKIRGAPLPGRVPTEPASAASPMRSAQRAPMSPLTLSTGLVPAGPKSPVALQRIFIGDKERFNMVEISSFTNAQDVLDAVLRQSDLSTLGGAGGLMVWEIAQDYGMERPIRSYERISEVTASWNNDKLVNTFVIKRTTLATILSVSAMPSSSPIFHGYVEWESKRGKWNKRWMELREQSLWLSKREKRKDEICLCSLSNFDCYFITRKYKAPKAFKFAVKSTDNLSFFENTADYVHVFSCGEKEGEQWMRNILLARCYVLHQERNILFSKPTGPNPGSATAINRSDTRRVARPMQPLVSVTTLTTATSSVNPVFEPGSLLAKRSVEA